ncbi:MAG: peptidylprolyl isomerase [Burkholderiales bacterium]|nr:peptidylprolyl isomerase [Burkholderiales bacterium]
MFNIVEKNQKFVKGIMIVVAATFVLWGIGGYLSNMGDDGYVAKVGSMKVYPQDIDNAISQNPQNTDKMQVMLGLINRQLLLNNIEAYHMVATKEQLQQQIAAMPIFQNSAGQFDLTKYQSFLREKLISAEEFQTTMGQQVLITEFIDLFRNSYFSSALFSKQFAKLISRERSVASYTINPMQFYSKINPNDKQINDYYTQNIAKFTIPERVKLQYLVLDPIAIGQNVKISDAEIKRYIDGHKAKMTGHEEVNASHILLAFPENADAKARAATKARAEQILIQVRQNPANFAKLAQQYSQDPGSANKGGNLGSFGRGVMVKPFENAAFNLKPGQISNLVETQYGYHIIKVNSISGNDISSVRKLALAQLQKQKAAALLQKDLDQLNDLSYNHPNSLDAAANQLGLNLMVSKTWVDKGGISGEFGDPKVQKAIFSAEVVVQHHNSEVVDLGNGSYAVYRVTDHKESKVEPLLDVKDQIVQQLKQQGARNMASEEGKKILQNLSDGKINLAFTNPQGITLLGQSPQVQPNTVKQIFAVNLSKLPAYTSSIDENGSFVIYKITGEHIDNKLNKQNEEVASQLLNSDSMAVFGAYLGSLRSAYDVTYKVDRLNLQSK